MNIMKIKEMGTLSKFREFFNCVERVQILQASKNRQLPVNHAGLEVTSREEKEREKKIEGRMMPNCCF